MKWLLIIILQSPPHSMAVVDLEMVSKEQCISTGQQLSKELTIVRNPNNALFASVKQSAKYSCHNIRRKK